MIILNVKKSWPILRCDLEICLEVLRNIAEVSGRGLSVRAETFFKGTYSPSRTFGLP